MLVAGTSCVDYSNLNNKKQDLDGIGESGQTFRGTDEITQLHCGRLNKPMCAGMMQWIRRCRPPIIILENVCSAPWDRVQALPPPPPRTHTLPLPLPLRRPPFLRRSLACTRTQAKFESEGYHASWARFDTKHHYIPHTRTRVYLVAVVNTARKAVAEEWKAKVKQPSCPSCDTRTRTHVMRARSRTCARTCTRAHACR